MREEHRTRCSWADVQRQHAPPITTPSGACRCTTIARCSNSSASKAHRPAFRGAPCSTSARTTGARSTDFDIARCAKPDRPAHRDAARRRRPDPQSPEDRRRCATTRAPRSMRSTNSAASMRFCGRSSTASRCGNAWRRQRRRAGDDAGFRSDEQGAAPSAAFVSSARRSATRSCRRPAWSTTTSSTASAITAPRAARAQGMIVTDPAEFLAAYSPERFPVRAASTARAAFLVGPAGADACGRIGEPTTATWISAQPFDVTRALAQHAELARRLGEDVPVISFPGPTPIAPDGMFPNNVFGTAPGRFIVGRMRHACASAKPSAPTSALFPRYARLLRWSIFRTNAFVAELTGSLVIDRGARHRLLRACPSAAISPARARCTRRSSLRLTFCFELAEGEYHTNVVMALLAGRIAMLAAGRVSRSGACRARSRAPWRNVSSGSTRAAEKCFLGQCDNTGARIAPG